MIQINVSYVNLLMITAISATCSKNTHIWINFRKCLHVVTKRTFNISLEDVIYGWDLDQSNRNFANLLLMIASYSVYTVKIRYSETKVFSPILLTFKFYIQKLDKIFQNTNKIPKLVLENRMKWDDLKIHLNIM